MRLNCQTIALRWLCPMCSSCMTPQPSPGSHSFVHELFSPNVKLFWRGVCRACSRRRLLFKSVHGIIQCYYRGMILADTKCILWSELVSLNEVSVVCRGLNVVLFLCRAMKERGSFCLKMYYRVIDNWAAVFLINVTCTETLKLTVAFSTVVYL